MDIRISNINLFIKEEVLNTFSGFIQSCPKAKEAGGVLTGKIFNDSIEILSCSTPSKFDKRYRHNFIRSHRGAQIFIDNAFERSVGEEIYLGEWHTHPEQIPTPSKVDMKNFIKTVTKNKLNSETHFMIIVGTVQTYIGLFVKGVLLEQMTFDNPVI